MNIFSFLNTNNCNLSERISVKLCLKVVHSLELNQNSVFKDKTLYSHILCHSLHVFKVLLLPLVLYLVQVFAQVLGLLL